MRVRQVAVYSAVVVASLAAGGLAELAVFGPQRALRSPLFGPVLERWLDRREGTIAIGAPMPPLQFPMLDGKPQRVPITGRATLINYWASWCGPCIREMPLLEAFSASQGTGERAVAVVGIALDDAAPVRAFLARQSVTFPILVEAPGASDSSVRLGNHRNVLPFSVLVGADGRVIARHAGAFETRGELQDWVAQAK